jgi:hypothetical protein
VLDRAVVKQRDVGRAAAHVDERDTELFLFIGQHRLGRGERLEHDVGDVEAGAVAALDDVLRRGDGAGDDVDLRLQAHAGHAERLLDAVLLVDDVVLRQDVQHLAVHRDRDRLRGVDHALDVARDSPLCS